MLHIHPAVKLVLLLLLSFLKMFTLGTLTLTLVCVCLLVSVWNSENSVMPEMQHQSYQWAEGVLGVLDWVSRIRWTQPTGQLFTLKHQPTLVLPWYTVSLCLMVSSGRWTITTHCCGCYSRCVSVSLAADQPPFTVALLLQELGGVKVTEELVFWRKLQTIFRSKTCLRD